MMDYYAFVVDWWRMFRDRLMHPPRQDDAAAWRKLIDDADALARRYGESSFATDCCVAAAHEVNRRSKSGA